jgi:hypothetical protein
MRKGFIIVQLQIGYSKSCVQEYHGFKAAKAVDVRNLDGIGAGVVVEG